MKTAPALKPDERLIRPISVAGAGPTRRALEELPQASEIDIGAELAFVDRLLAKYTKNNDKAVKPFQEVKGRIAQRQSETRLFLGVIGEFSSGKSTLINALIRDTLLRMENLPGTTAAATLLYHGDSLEVKVRKRKKHVARRAATGVVAAAKAVWRLFFRRPQPTRDDLLNLIHRATTNEMFAKDIVQVDVRTPSARLLNGLVVVDTPGANASNPRHGLVTVAALRDVCDAALVVVPAEMAGSESLFQFLQAHAADVLYRCVFVVTKIDLIRREKERDRVLQGLRARIQQQLEIPNPRVVACAPQFVVESLGAQPGEEADFSPEEIRTWVAHFEEMEQKLEQILRQKRLQAQIDDIARLIVQLFSHLQSLLNEQLTAYRERHDALARIIIPDIGQFIKQRIRQQLDTCQTQLGKVVRDSGREFSSVVDSIQADMSRAISSADSRKALQATVEATIPRIYTAGQSQLQALLQRTLQNMSATGHSELKVFHKEFQKHFNDLATLGGKLAIDQPDTHALARGFSDRTEAANRGIADELKGLDQAQKLTTFGMAAGGAAIGTFLFPGVGTIIGGLLGGVFSYLFGPSLDELKAQCFRQLEPQVTAALREFAEAAEKAIDDAGDATLRELADRIGSYQPRYESLVQRMKDRDAAEKAQLQEFQKQIEEDLRLIEEHRLKIDHTRQRLREL